MTDEEEYAIRSRLKWQRDGSSWLLLYGRRRMGRVVPDGQYPGMWRVLRSRGLSDMANLSWAKDAVVGAAIREIAWDVANTPSKPQVKRPSAGRKSSPMRLAA